MMTCSRCVTRVGNSRRRWTWARSDSLGPPSAARGRNLNISAPSRSIPADRCCNRPLRDQTQEYSDAGTNGKLVSSRVSDVHQTVHNRSPSDIANKYPIAIGTGRGKNFSEKLHYGPTVCLRMRRDDIATRYVDMASDRNCIGGAVCCTLRHTSESV